MLFKVWRFLPVGSTGRSEGKRVWLMRVFLHTQRTGQAVCRMETLLAEPAEVNLFLVSCRSYPQVHQEPEWLFSIYSLTLSGRWLNRGAP